jgi:hypothetical protein
VPLVRPHHPAIPGVRKDRQAQDGKRLRVEKEGVNQWRIG